MKISVVQCFCMESYAQGNPATVVQNFEGSQDLKQMLAAEQYRTLKIPVTVFIENNNLIRFFYPSSEMSMCVHGALAAAKVILKNSIDNFCVFKTIAGKEIYIKRNKEILQAILKQESLETKNLSDRMLRQMLGLPNGINFSPNHPSGVASVGSLKYLVPLSSPDQLAMLNPDYNKIIQSSELSAINGLYVYAPLNKSGNEYVARGFNPAGGSSEDAATGVAVGALISVLAVPSITVLQGDFIQRRCRIIAEYNNEVICVGGIVRLDALE